MNKSISPTLIESDEQAQENLKNTIQKNGTYNLLINHFHTIIYSVLFYKMCTRLIDFLTKIPYSLKFNFYIHYLYYFSHQLIIIIC